MVVQWRWRKESRKFIVAMVVICGKGFIWSVNIRDEGIGRVVYSVRTAFGAALVRR